MSFFKNPFKKELTEEQIKTDKLGEDVVELLRINKDFVNNNYSDSDITLGIRDYGDFSARIYFENCKLQSVVLVLRKTLRSSMVSKTIILVHLKRLSSCSIICLLDTVDNLT